jgi:DNA-binding transcriptional ArsR family regulator
VATQTKSIDELVAFVVKHPLRVDALSVLGERVASPSEIADLCGADLNKVSNHIKALAEAGCIEAVRTETRRGAIEHFYRASLRPNIGVAEWEVLSEPARLEISALVFQTIVAEGLAALRTGSFDSRTDRHLAWRPLTLDDDGWAELTKELAESLERLEEIQARAYGRLADSGEQGVTVLAAAMAFERAAPGRARRRTEPTSP